MQAAITIAPQRTWAEVRDAVQARTDRQVYPMPGMRSEDARVILSRIHSLDARWSALIKAKNIKAD